MNHSQNLQAIAHLSRTLPQADTSDCIAHHVAALHLQGFTDADIFAALFRMGQQAAQAKTAPACLCAVIRHIPPGFVGGF